ncbi:MAG: YihY/virulence factor BrkB family protein [Crocinitomicaceae bacterium]|nr:YihY/virulence factor BrkB family protein [Crocinitomicaceae bacterium]
MKPIIKKIKRFSRVLRVTIVRRTIHVSRKIVLPGFEGLSMWEVLFFFAWSLKKGLITQRAAALSFNFFLAMVPFGLLLVVLSAYLPVYDIEKAILPILAGFIPQQLVETFMVNMHDFENSSVSSWLSFGFILTLYFASNGFAVMINTFNTSRIKIKKRRSWISVRLVSVLFVLVFLIGILASFFILLTEKRMLNNWADHSAFVESHYYTFFIILNSLFFAVLLYFAIALIFYFGPSNRGTFRFLSAGATLTTLMIVLISVLYVYYINGFAKYNEIYGSIGTIMILLLWIYFVSISLLVGFELNASIHGALAKKRLDQLEDIESRQEKNY